MAAPDNVVNLAEKLALVEDQWSPKIVGRMNDLHLLVAKVEGEFLWHQHVDTDEFFLVTSGRLTIQLEDRDDVVIDPGEFFVVPRGVSHCPTASEECHILLMEPVETINTGDAPQNDRTATAEWI